MSLKYSVLFFVLLAACADDGPATTGPAVTADCTKTAGGVEICDGVDNDCDGEVDEGFEIGESCSTTSSTCTGVFVCAADKTKAECEVSAESISDEICDGLDNNCDGVVDEGFDLGVACTAGQGPCANTGVTVCSADGATAECDAVAGSPDGAELCDGLDNNCDGEIDEGFSSEFGKECSGGQGECAYVGTIVCQTIDPTQLACEADVVEPTAEICDDLDNDCDGETDEDFPTKGTACTIGVGACVSEGIFVCSENGDDVVCDATVIPPPQATESSCDNIDNDCDGMVDEGCDDDGDDYCDSAFTLTQSTACPKGGNDCDDTNPAVNPGAAEVCDGIDNDCDLKVDVSATDASTFYLDCDADTYSSVTTGAQLSCNAPPVASAVSQCSLSSARWTTKAPNITDVDCNPTNANVHPGQAAYFKTAMTGNPLPTTNTFDYNCDGQASKKWPHLGKASDPCPIGNWIMFPNTPGQCFMPVDQSEGWVTFSPNCGSSGTYTYCDYKRQGTTSTCTGTRKTRTQTQECR